jgi:hypothetical protein
MIFPSTIEGQGGYGIALFSQKYKQGNTLLSALQKRGKGSYLNPNNERTKLVLEREDCSTPLDLFLVLS